MPAYVSECLYMCVFERLYVFVCSYVYECAFIHVCVIFTDFVYPAVYLFTRWIIYTGIENLSCLSWTLCQGKPTLSDGSLWHWGHCDTGYSAGHVTEREETTSGTGYCWLVQWGMWVKQEKDPLLISAKHLVGCARQIQLYFPHRYCYLFVWVWNTLKAYYIANTQTRQQKTTHAHERIYGARQRRDGTNTNGSR